MKVLLIGDYSSVHSELKTYLQSEGIDIQLASDGDGYKNFDRDIDLKSSPFPISLFLKKNKAFAILFGLWNMCLDFLGVKGFITYFRIKKKLRNIKGLDVIQLINTAPISSLSSIPSYFLIRFLLRNNSNAKLFLLAAGDDYAWANYCINHKKSTYFKDSSFKKITYYLYTLKYKYGLFYPFLHRYVLNKSHRIIPILEDYYACYKDHEKCTEIIPIPLSSDKFSPPKKTQYPIEIFHGWQKGSELRKGNLYFHSVIQKLQKELGKNYVTYNLVQSVPYNEYIQKYTNSDIFIDQAFSLDRGVNGALGMAASKVVFSGYNPSLHKVIGINAKPDTIYLYHELKELILNIASIDEIKSRAYDFTLSHHKIEQVASKYLNLWETTK